MRPTDRTLTDDEIAALPEPINLADGHAYRPWNPVEDALIDRVNELFRAGDRRHQRDFEGAYLDRFFSLAGQTRPGGGARAFLCFTASTALEVIANHLRLEGRSVALIEPCFDNLGDILRRHSLPLEVLPETWLSAEPAQLTANLSGLRSDVVFIVSPNNPTGAWADERSFRSVVEACRASEKLLVLDSCFRFYLPRDLVFDQYRVLEESGIDWIVIEDTGKTWPTSEVKAPFFCASRSLAEPLAHLYADFVLHVPPFAVRLLDEFLRLSENDGLAAVHDVVALNRAVLLDELDGTFLRVVGASFMSMGWIEIDAPVTGEELRERLASEGVFVLSGERFFWSDPAQGASMLRIALVRDNDMMREAARRIREVVDKVTSELR